MTTSTMTTSPTTTSVLITLDSMRHANTGLYTYGHSLGREFVRQAGDQFRLAAYTYPEQQGVLGPEIDYVRNSRLDRWFFRGGAGFDVVHFADQYCRFGPARVKGKSVMTIHDLNQLHERTPGYKLERFMRRMGVKIAGVDRIVTISQFVAADVERHFPQARGKTSVIYNGADVTRAPDGHRPQQVPDAPFLFTIGMVCPKKNFHVLVPLLKNNAKKLVIAGIIKEDYKDLILRDAQELGVADRVMITGPISEHDKAWYYANCEAFVFPSLAEGFGLPVIEAMHHGKPVFLSTHTSLPEIGGDAAYYFDNFDPAAMIDVLERGMLDFAATGGPERVRAHASQFTWEKAAAAYLALFRSLAAA